MKQVRYNKVMRILIKVPITFMLLLSLFVGKASAAQYAIVAAYKAMVYADNQLKVPVGYLKRGTKIKVGERLQNFGTSLPMVYQKRIVYLKALDLSLIDYNKNAVSDDPSLKEYQVHDPSYFDPPIETNWSENNYFLASMGRVTHLASQSQSLSENISGNTFKVGVAHRNPFSPFHVQLDFSYSSFMGFEDTLSWAYPQLSLTGIYRLMNLKLFSVELLVGAGFSGEVAIKSANGYSYEGSSHEFFAGAQGVVPAYGKIGAILTMLYKKNQTSSIRLKEGPAIEPTADVSLEFPTLTSIEITASLLYRF